MGPFWPPGCQCFWSFSSRYEGDTDDARNMLPSLSRKGATLARVTRCTMAQQIILVNPEFPTTALVGFTSLKPILALGFPSERSHWTLQGSHHPHQVVSLLLYCHYCRKGRAAHILLCPSQLSHFPLSPQALGSSRSYSAVCIYSIRSPPFQTLTWTGAAHPLEASAFEFKGVGEWQQN